jgi:formate hydrogenlyase subunit 3/multisubunit Na+/H+ antiporter MnhD subunit
MPVVAAVAGMTIITGNLMAIPQHNIKRLLAYSGIAHIGYMLIGLAALSSNGIAMVLFYLIAYLFGNMGAFFVVEAVARSENSEEIDAYKGLAQRSPLLALAMLVFLLSLGGIPFVAGFWAKLYVFLAAIDRGMYGLVFLGAVLSNHLTVLLAIGPMFVFGMGAGVASPAALSQAISVNPQVIGSASGLYGFSQMGVGAICTALVGLGSNPALSAAIILAAAGVIGQVSFWIALRYRPAA